jgi:hypothetical protein
LCCTLSAAVASCLKERQGVMEYNVDLGQFCGVIIILVFLIGAGINKLRRKK